MTPETMSYLEKGGGLALLGLVLYGIYQLADKKFIPMLKDILAAGTTSFIYSVNDFKASFLNSFEELKTEFKEFKLEYKEFKAEVKAENILKREQLAKVAEASAQSTRDIIAAQQKSTNELTCSISKQNMCLTKLIITLVPGAVEAGKFINGLNKDEKDEKKED